MPVYLDAIPDVAPNIKRPHIRRWLWLLVVIMVVGSGLTFWFWREAREGLIFWFMALGVPFCLWGLLFGIRRFGYKCDQVWAASWDRERAQLLEQETRRGQRFAWLLHAGVTTQLGSGADKLLNAVEAATALAVQLPRQGSVPLRHARLAGFDDNRRVDDFERAINTIASRLKPMLAEIPADVPCWLLVNAEVAGIPDVDERVLPILVSQTGRPCRRYRRQGLAAFDRWLDEAWKTPAILVVVSAVVRATPQEGEGEAISYQLLLNRHHPGFPDAVRLHRPEKGSPASLAKILDRALLWCHLPAAAVKGVWTTGQAVAQGGEWALACEENQLALNRTEDNRDIDQTTGYTGIVAPWLAITLAATQAPLGGSQVVAAETGTDEIWIVGITTGDSTGIKRDLL
ncbi:hypothetical protein [Serratia sp. DD3]|uniref:hypothetical protein n=1 Tax=Serratia sp. DD3 TaxID=1410619 RepID=UPI0003C510C3|nr:hypothetical protein [Serratia sp. DD3]KEY57886.1 hypothetical protein SRDD_31980 [Serratia sp. DD3]